MEYKVVSKFLSPVGDKNTMTKMVVIQDERGACVMPKSEWRYVFGVQHKERWENGKKDIA